MSKLAKNYEGWINDEMKVSFEEFQVQSVGKVDPKKHLGIYADELISSNVNQTLGLMVNSKAF